MSQLTCTAPGCTRPILRADPRAMYCTPECRYTARRERERTARAERRAANPDAARELYRRDRAAWRAKNGERHRMQEKLRRTQDPEHDAELRRATRQRNAGRISLQKRNRAALQRATGVRFTPSQVAAKFLYWGNQCWMCGAADTSLTLDHIKPLIAGGSHFLSNVRPACKSCNSSKNGRWYGPHHLDRFTRLAA